MGHPGGVRSSAGTTLEGGDRAEGEPTDERVIIDIESGRVCIRAAVTNLRDHHVDGEGQLEARGFLAKARTDFVLPSSYLFAAVFRTGLWAAGGRGLLHNRL